jgi:hypothetical protein
MVAVPLKQLQLLEAQDQGLVSPEELPSGFIWSNRLGSLRPLAEGLQEVMQHLSHRPEVKTTKPGALTPGICLLSLVPSHGGRAQLCVVGA